MSHNINKNVKYRKRGITCFYLPADLETYRGEKKSIWGQWKISSLT